MANQNRKIFGFFAKKIGFAKKVYFDVPHAIGAAWAHFRRTHCSLALSKRSSDRSRRAMAVAPMFSRRRAKRGALLFAFGFFFAKTLHPSAFVKFQLFFSKPTSPRQFKFLKTEPQLNTLPSHVRRFQMFLDWAILLASKTRLLQKFLGFFSILRNFTT